ncbi:M56 family metallopeptidase [Pseudoalteromonas sp. SG45-5]|uniref:M56 family metallopeptidase n=1 Tax=unclassified Pseudoalteromonas TaxID=194690 RepID=UPI0015FAC2D4|nr:MULTISPECIES: M56 family metallopeptidase [unclassified Pseudoalteromonas]MBB1386103.1 M56 family metallopeptidase [Pseudoalteromonas sp. SG45-5]MBB1394013.1 M56 family metallopeptidase [Pseudoalteromonas sp. SG44-4]MBB1446351.1 M56 family metallopeptidase [Pseudoalteromonas sp. SG41-6]
MVIQTGFNWLIEQQLLLSILFCGFILLERFALKALGSRFVYKLAWLLPAALIIANLPNAIKPLQNSNISHYLITPNQPFTSEVGVSWALMYVLITSGLLLAIFATHTRFVKSLQLTELTHFKGALTAGVKTYISQYVATPMVVGILNSKLVLPSNYNTQFDKATLALILEHENVHIKRKDNLTNALILLPTILLWFNPLAWFCYASMRRLQELTCDERVLSNKTTQQHILYSKALINCAANAPTGLMAYSHYGDKKTMLQRLTNIKHSGKHSKFAKGGLLLVAASMLSGLAIAKQPEAITKEDHISPTMRIEPLYPIQAAQQGISGSVVLKYDITPNGETANVSVVSAKPEAIFDREAKKALRQWQYKPSSMGYQNVLVQLDFAINNEVANTDLIERIKVSH